MAVAGDVPARIRRHGGRRRLRTGRRAGGTPAGGGHSRRRRTDLAAVEDAAMDVGVRLDLECQLEVARLAAAPDDERAADAPGGRALGGDRAVLDPPHLRVAVPALERPAVEDLRPAGVVRVVDRVGREAAARARTDRGLGGRRRAGGPDDQGRAGHDQGKRPA